LSKKPQAAPRIAAEDAWSEVHDRIEHVGSYRSASWSHPAIEAAVKALGWSEICTNGNIEATRAHFFRIFEAIQRRAFQDASLKIAAEKKPELASLAGRLVQNF